jgi:hypothetical protein
MTHPIAFPPPSTVPELALAKEVRAMFLGNEQGAWYDPSDMSTLFQDAAGTTPVTAVEQPVGLVLDKSKGLVRGIGPELVSNGDFSSGTTGWSDVLTTTTIINGQASVASSSAGGRLGRSISVASGWHEARFDIVSVAGANTTSVRFGSTSGGSEFGSFALGVGSHKVRINCTASTLWIGLFPGQVGTAVFDNISVKQENAILGSHAFQTTAASRPVLSARVNRLLKTESPTEWTNAVNTFTVVNSGAGAFELSALTADGTANAYIGPHSNYPVGASLATPATIIRTIEVKKGSARYLRFGAASDSDAIFFDLENAVAVRNGGGVVLPVQITMLADGWLRLEFWVSRSSWGASQLSYQMAWSPSWPGSSSLGPTGQIGSTVWFRNVSFVVESFNYTRPIRYQRVNTATDYDTAGFPHYLRFDGVDDFLQTNAINFTSTDKMTVFAGVRKLSDAVPGMLVELSTNINVAPGAFYVTAPELTGANGDYRFRSRGELSANTAPSTGSASAPTTDVVVGIGDISGDYKAIRRNGVLGGSSPEDQGSGNFGNYPLFIGRRGGTSLPFNGHLYQLVIRGAQSTPSQIQAGERWTNNRTGAY